MYKELIRDLNDERLHQFGDLSKTLMCRLKAAHAIETLVDQVNELLGSLMHLDKTSTEEINDLQAEIADKDREIERLKKTRDAAIADISCGWMCAVCQNRIRGKEWTYCSKVKFTNGIEDTSTCANFLWAGEREKTT